MAIKFDNDVGMVVDDTSDTRQTLVEAWQTIFSDADATVNTSPDTPNGQIIDSMAVLVTAKDSEILNLANQFNPKKASGIWQDAIGSIYFLERKMAQPTVVTCQCTGLQGTVIPQNAVIQTDDGEQLVSIASATIPTAGTVDVEFKTVKTGAVEIGANTCNKIVSVVAGWDSVTNASAGALGRDVESRFDFEKRRALSVALNSHGSRLSLQSAVASVNDVLDCLVLENRSDSTVTKQGVSMISHSVAICVYGGSDDDIAEMIYNKIDAGCGTNGASTVTYVSEDGAVNDYQIVRPTATPIYVRVEINKTATTLNTVVEDIKNAVINDFNGNDLNSGNARRGCGDTIYASSLSVAVVKTAGVSDLVSITIGRSASATGNYVEMDADEEPIISASTINVIINE